MFEINRRERIPSGPLIPRSPTPSDSDQEDQYEADLGFPEINKKGDSLRLKVSLKSRHDFSELLREHMEGPIWEILTGVEARTKLTNSELKHEGTRNHQYFNFEFI